MENIFGKRLREIRKVKGLTQAELAEALGTSQSRIADYESGRTQPTVPILIRLARFLGVSADYLLGLTDDPSPRRDGLSPLIRQKLEECEKLKEKFERMKQIFLE